MSALRIDETKQKFFHLRREYRRRHKPSAELHRTTEFLRYVRDRQTASALK